MSRAPSRLRSLAPTPDPSSPPVSESAFSEIDGITPSVIETSADFAWDARKIDPTALNLVSWKLDVNARAGDGVEKRGFNAISTVLNHPTRKANPLRASRKPLPPLTQPPPILPKFPPPAHYDAYLKSITPLYDGFVASHASSSLSAEAGDLDLRSSRPTKPDVPALDTVPQSFFESDFSLANPVTWAEIVDSNGAGQDALSTYLDTLESHLIHEISLRSTSFFSALSNLQDLDSESASCLSRISDLQASLREVGSQQARKGLEVIDAHERLRILRVTETGVRTVGELEELVRVTRGLVEVGDWAGGLGCLGDVVRWWERHALRAEEPLELNGDTDTRNRNQKSPSTRILPLSTLPALSHLPSVFQNLTIDIVKQLEAAVSSFLLSVLSRADSDQAFDAAGFRDAAGPMLRGLMRCGKRDRIEEVWREAVITSIREGSRKHLPVGHADDDAEDEGRPSDAKGANLAQLLRGMDHSRFLLLSTRMFGSMLSRLHLAQQVGDEMAMSVGNFSSITPLTISSSVPDPPSSSTSKFESLGISDVLSSACELANTRASKILAVRSEQHAALSLTEFVEIFKENWEFVVATETMAKRMIVSLRGVTASQARAFLVTYHAIRLTKSAKLVEEEQWSQVDISLPIQRTVNVLIESAVTDPIDCAIPPPSPLNLNGDAAQPAKVLNVEEKTFYVVKATGESLLLLRDYLSIVINIELVVTDVMSRIIEFLKSFNSRTCQVVLGAGAMRSAGLKNITAKHLALASQSLSVIVSLIPYIREFIRRHLNPKQAVMLTEFDKLKRDYQEHQNEIHTKLVAIMSDRLAVHCASLRVVDWESASDKDGTRPYTEMLVKETATLHKVLSKYLAPQTVEGVMSEVLAAIVHRLSEEYGKIELKSDDGKKRMMQDVVHISSRLSPLSESGKSVGSLVTLVKDKPTPRRPMGQAMAGLLRKASVGTSAKKAQNGVRDDTTEGLDEEVDDDEDGVGMLSEPAPIEKLNGDVVSTGRIAEMGGIDAGGESMMASDRVFKAAEEAADDREEAKIMDETAQGTSMGIQLDTAAPELPNETSIRDQPPLPPPTAPNIGSSTLPTASSTSEPPVPPDKLEESKSNDNGFGQVVPEKEDPIHLHE
ncbi:MAG: hypothetical protein TREMPRED_005695 [Tremellales sp. Tagirdzhanova-0007]|nr:MAG: hypothetical protein TREMPRED_005695 [Tremellales sp. Tagirdzhanova-0007]